VCCLIFYQLDLLEYTCWCCEKKGGSWVDGEERDWGWVGKEKGGK